MKKSEALKILGLADGATDDAVKQAHRRLVVAHHPDKLPLDSPERAAAEELTKRINEARDVLLNRSWTPEFDPRRDPRPYAGNPYAHPAAGSAGAGRGSSDPFADWPFAQGQPTSAGGGRTTYVWTSWDGARSASGEGRPFDPFAPFWTAGEQRKTPEEVRAEAKLGLKREALLIGGKAALLVVASLLGGIAAGLFLYVMASVLAGLYKRVGSCLVGCIVPLALLGAPFVFLIAPRQGAVTIALAVAFFVAVLFDAVNVRNLVRAYRAAERTAS